MTPPAPSRTIATVTLVTAPGCHYCDDAHTYLRALIDDGTLIQLAVVEATSAQGRSLLGVHRPAMNPLVLVDDAYFSAGRLPRRKLHALLRRHEDGAEAANHG